MFKSNILILKNSQIFHKLVADIFSKCDSTVNSRLLITENHDNTNLGRPIMHPPIPEHIHQWKWLECHPLLFSPELGKY